MAELTAQDIASVSAGYWAVFYKIILATGKVFSFDGREYQIEPMESKSPRICYMKGTGGGFSENAR